MQRLRRSGTSILGTIAIPSLRRKALNSWAAVQDTYFSTKDIFERHKVVFTVSTSIASVLTAWMGYSLRHHHESKVEERLASIEKAMNNHHHVEHKDIKKIVNSGNVSTAACVATAGTTLIVGYGLGWRGGKWYANRKFRKEQLKLLGQIKPSRWHILRRQLVRSRTSDTAHRDSNVTERGHQSKVMQGGALTAAHVTQQSHPS